MIDKAISTIVLIIAAICNLPMLIQFIWAAYKIDKEYKIKKSEEDSND
jgi:high-affinity nickel permease